MLGGMQLVLNNIHKEVMHITNLSEASCSCGFMQARVRRGWTALARVNASTWQMESFFLKPPFDLHVTGALGETLTLRWVTVHHLSNLSWPCFLQISCVLLVECFSGTEEIACLTFNYAHHRR